MKEMNQDALSLTGLRLGIFSQIMLILHESDAASQTYDTRQEDIYNIFLEAGRLEAQVTETSGNPVTSAAILRTLQPYCYSTGASMWTYL